MDGDTGLWHLEYGRPGLGLRVVLNPLEVTFIDAVSPYPDLCDIHTNGKVFRVNKTLEQATAEWEERRQAAARFLKGAE